MLWCLGNLAWLAQDRLVRDGDEEGHVGAAELFLHRALDVDIVGFLDMAWRGSLGEYPPLFPALIGGGWALLGGGDPGRVGVRVLGLVGPLLAAVSMGWMAGQHVPAKTADGASPTETARAIALVLGLGLPLAGALGRHFMPEGLLVGAVALAVATASWAGQRPGLGRAVLLGGVFAAGLLVKQTFVLYAAVPVLIFGLIPLGRWSLATALTSAAVAGPWYLGQGAAQLDYVAASVDNGHSVGVLAGLAYYPALVSWSLAGPVVCVAAVFGAMRVERGPTRRAAIGAVVWFLTSLLLLVAIPKKYPRLGAPLGLPVVLLAGLGLSRVRRPAVVTGIVGGGALVWSAGLAMVDLQSAPWTPVVDPRCEQRWLRPPSPDDLGLAAVVDAVRHAGEGVVAVAGAPDIPCAVQTTHPWLTHLEPALRRAGLEREVVSGVVPDAAVQVRFGPPTAGSVPVPGLDRQLTIVVAQPR